MVDSRISRGLAHVPIVKGHPSWRETLRHFVPAALAVAIGSMPASHTGAS